MVNEEWKAVKGYEEFYEVSTTGKVRSVERIIHDKKCDRIFKGQEFHPTEHNGKQPYYYVSMCRNGKSRKELVHRLVATTFLPNSDCRFPFYLSLFSVKLVKLKHPLFIPVDSNE